MPRVRTRRPGRLLTAAVVAVALVLAACGAGPTEPSDVVGDAIDQTLQGSFAFSLRVDADDAGRALLTEEDPQFAALLRTVEIRGTIDRPAVQFTVEALGFEVFELRRVEVDRTYVRLDPDALAMLSEGDFDVAEARADLEEAPAPLRAAGEALLDGGWVALDGDLRELGDDAWFPGGMLLPFGGFGMVEDEEAKEAFRRHVAADVGEFIDRFTVVTEAAGDDDVVYDVTFQLRELARAVVDMLSEAGGPFAWLAEEEVTEDDFDEVPASVGGLSVTVAERRVRRLALDVLEVARSLTDEVPAGTISIVAELSDHGSAPAIEEPDDAAVLDLAELFEQWWDFGHLESLTIEDEIVIEGDAVEVAPDDPDGEASAPTVMRPQREVMLLAMAQESRYADGLGYTDDVGELTQHGFVPTPGVAYGACLYDEADAFVVGVSSDGDTAYFDSRQANQPASTDQLDCVPELAVLE